MKDNRYISIIGNVASGKTTAAKIFSSYLNAKLIEEPFIENPFFPLFIKDPKRWAFENELYFLYERGKQLREIKKYIQKQSVVADSGFLMGPFVYTKTQYKLGRLTDIEWEFYQKFIPFFKTDLKNEDIIIYIKASPAICLKRLRSRKNSLQNFHSLSYIQTLHESLEELRTMLIKKGENVIGVDSEKTNFLKEQGRKELLKIIRLP